MTKELENHHIPYNYDVMFYKIFGDYNDLVEIDGYKARLLTQSELTSKYGYEYVNSSPSDNGYRASSDTPTWIYINDKTTWSMTEYDDSNTTVYGINYWLKEENVYNKLYIRPVINLKKCALEGTC